MSAVTIIPPGTETEDAYHASGAWGSTLISHFLKSPQLAHRIRTGAYHPERTAAMRLGQVFHQRCDPSFAFDTRYRRGPDADKRSKAWKEADAAATAEGISLLTDEEWVQVHAMRNSVLANPIAAHLLEGAEHEVGFRMEVPVGGFRVQCRADVLHRWSHLADLKTTPDVDDFAKSVHGYAYYRQAALYRWIVFQACGKWLPFSFIAVEKAAPLYCCRVVDLSAEYLALGLQEVDAALAEIGRRTAANDWDDHRDAEVLEPPSWLRAFAPMEAA